MKTSRMLVGYITLTVHETEIDCIWKFTDGSDNGMTSSLPILERTAGRDAKPDNEFQSGIRRG